MSKLRVLLTLAAMSVALPALAGSGGNGYVAVLKVTEDGDVVSSGSTFVEKGEPVRMGVSHTKRYGGEDGPEVKAGFEFEMRPEMTGDRMHLEINLRLTEVVNDKTGATREEASLIQGDATREGDAWTYRTDKLPGGKVLKVTLREAPRPE